MRRVRIVRADTAQADDVDELTGGDASAGAGDYSDYAEVHDLDEGGSAYLEYDEEPDDAYLDEEEYEDQPVGLFGTPGRAIALTFSALLLLVIVGISAWLLGQGTRGGLPAYASNGTNSATGSNTGVQIGLTPPDFELIDMYTGKGVKLSSLRGKPVWINFWATWCAPCRSEMPQMKERYAKYRDKGLVILGVDDMEDNATVSQYVKEGGYDWTFVIDGDGAVLEKYNVTGIPTHVFVDKTGIIRSIMVGGISGPMMDDGLKKIMGD